MVRGSVPKYQSGTDGFDLMAIASIDVDRRRPVGRVAERPHLSAEGAAERVLGPVPLYRRLGIQDVLVWP